MFKVVQSPGSEAVSRVLTDQGNTLGLALKYGHVIKLTGPGLSTDVEAYGTRRIGGDDQLVRLMADFAFTDEQVEAVDAQAASQQENKYV